MTEGSTARAERVRGLLRIAIAGKSLILAFPAFFLGAIAPVIVGISLRAPSRGNGASP